MEREGKPVQGDARSADQGRGRVEGRAGHDQPLTFNVATLLSDRREAVLLHGGEHYRLRITARGKLILTK